MEAKQARSDEEETMASRRNNDKGEEKGGIRTNVETAVVKVVAVTVVEAVLEK